MKFGNSQRILIKISRFKEVITNLIIISLELVSLFVTLVLFRLHILRYLSYCDELVKLLWPTLGKVLLSDESEKKKRKVQFFFIVTDLKCTFATEYIASGRSYIWYESLTVFPEKFTCLLKRCRLIDSSFSLADKMQRYASNNRWYLEPRYSAIIDCIISYTTVISYNTMSKYDNLILN